METEAPVVEPTQSPAVIPPPQLPAVLPKLRRTVTEKKFVGALIVRTNNGEKLAVPRTAEANRARTQLIATRATDFFTAQLKKWTDTGVLVDPKKVSEFINAAKTLQELNEAAHGNGSLPDAGSPLTGLGQIVQGAVLAGAAVQEGKNISLVEEMRKLRAFNQRATAERKEIVVTEVK